MLLIDADKQTLDAAPLSDWASGLTGRDVYNAHLETLADLVNLAFGGLLLSDPVKDDIIKVAALSLLKEYERSALTGLVFPEFGADEIFPSLISFEIYDIVAGKLKFSRTSRFDVDRTLEPDAAVIPFAQKEMVDRFIYGLDGEFLDLSNRYFAGALTALKDHLTGLIYPGADAISAAISPAIDAILDEFNGVIVQDHLARSREQLSDMVRSMPKQELAALPESLVHITSLKRKFSAGAESVGGPIDVAMIARTEGFVWVKRKHYFHPGLNPRYFFAGMVRQEMKPPAA